VLLFELAVIIVTYCKSFFRYFSGIHKASKMSSTSKLGFDLTHHCLRVVNLKEVAQFYSDKFGMPQFSQSLSNENVTFCGFTDTLDSSSRVQRGKTILELHQLKNESVQSIQSQKTYWKIGVCFQDVKMACKKLRELGVEIGSPSQFRDIGYLCHLSDSDGFTIELLQTDFEKNFKPIQPDPSFKLLQPGVLGQITIRSSNADKALNFYRDTLGMKLLSIQPVTPYGFTLYFLAWTDDVPPSSDLNDVVIREWLWKRPYTTIEIQVNDRSSSFESFSLDDDKAGFMGMRAVCNNFSETKNHFESIGLNATTGHDELFDKPILTVTDPDGIPIIFMEHN